MQACWLVLVLVASRRLLSTCSVLLIVVGCRQSPTTVVGTVTLDGKPLTSAADVRGTVVFQPAGGQGTLATGVLDSTGHYHLATGSSSEIALGKYQVAVSVTQLLPKTERAEQSAKQLTPAKYASANESGLQANVIPGENRFNFDLMSDVENGTSSPAIPVPIASPQRQPVPNASEKTEGN